MGWLSGFTFRKQITIAGSTVGAQSDYQMKLTVHKGAGSDSGGDVYLNNHCQDDFDDIRFTKSDGNTKLDYWIEEYTSGDNAVVWIEFDSIPASPDTATFYLYYSKADATSESNGDNTFLWFNDYASAVGFTYFPYGVNTKGGENAAGWALDSGTLKHTQQQANTHEHALASLSHTNVAIHTKGKLNELTAATAFGVNLRYSDSGIMQRYWFRYQYYGSGAGQHSIQLNRCKNGSDTALATVDITCDTNWHKLIFSIYGTTLKCYLDGVEKINVTDSAISSGDYLGLMGESTQGRIQYFDDTFVRKYIEPEPTWGSWGIEQIQKIGAIYQFNSFGVKVYGG